MWSGKPCGSFHEERFKKREWPVQKQEHNQDGHRAAGSSMASAEDAKER